MKSPRPKGRFAPALLGLLAFVCLAAPAARAGDDDWRPVDPAHLSMKTPVVERDADAEAIFWDVRVDDASAYELVFTHYIRIKVFTDRGRESQSKVEIPYFNRVKIKDVAARTIKPDGSVVELKKDDVFDRTVVKVGGFRVKVKTFAIPAVEPGSIVEYRWREVRNTSADYTRLLFQREIPIQSVTYAIKPFAYSGQNMRAHFFNMPHIQPKKVKNGFYELSMANVPAFREEPHMPPADQVRMWTLIYYTPEARLAPSEFWKLLGKLAHERFKSDMKPNDEVKRAAAEIVGDAAAPEQKLERIFNFVRTKIKNVNDDASGLSAADLERMKENKSPADTLKRGMGTGGNINMLFAALATAAGFDARLAWTADRGDFFFDPSFTDTYFLRTTNIAVRVGDRWRFYDPASMHVPHGMLRWQEEGTATLVTDPKEPVFLSSPMSGPEKSLTRRVAKLKLGDDGTLEGEVRIEYTGHAAAAMKESYDEDTPADREEALKQAVTSRIGAAELSDIRVENVNDVTKPFTYAYRVRIPGYATRTGKRLFLNPAFFQRGMGPLFPTAGRRNEIYFHYAWSEEDEVEIVLPAGFALDNAESPASFGAGPVSQYKVKLGVTKDERTLIYRRSFFFGGAGGSDMYDMNRLRFPAAQYTTLKQYFDQVHTQDGHTLSLKQAAATTAAAGTGSN